MTPPTSDPTPASAVVAPSDEILELRILPPLVIGRLGAASSPMDNYRVDVGKEEPLGPRKLVPAPTLRVDEQSGQITESFTPTDLRFTDVGAVRPVAPFLEVWALTKDGLLRPLTTELLRANDPAAQVKWRVHVANHKIQRRTGAADDKIDADTGWFEDHKVKRLLGTCANFLSGKQLPLGHVQYIAPTTEFPEVRLRFTPAAGHVYGSGTPSVQPKDPDVKEALYNAEKGTWKGHYDKPLSPLLTNPAEIYAGYQDDKGHWVSKGYLDDGCDGLVYVSVTITQQKATESGHEVVKRELNAYARVGSGPPAYVPDTFPVRTVAHDLDQAMFGPDVKDADVTPECAEEIVRRAFETVRLMNTAVMNGNTIDGRVDAASTMVRQDTADTGRLFEPIMAPSLMDSAALRSLHQNVLVALRSGTAPWFADVLRKHTEVGDLTNKARRKMPALMRGADGRALALTRRQVNLVRKAATRQLFNADGSGGDAGIKSGPPAHAGADTTPAADAEEQT